MERFAALVLSHDPEVVRVINKALETYGLEANVARNVGDANELVKDRRFDLAVCDYDLPGAQNLAYLEPSSAWRGMVFALIRPERLTDIHGRRVHLTLPKPLSAGLFGKGLKAAYSTMAHERRSAARYSVDANAVTANMIEQGKQRVLGRTRVVNVSHTGMCLQTEEMLPQHATVHVTFPLPQAGLITVAGNVVWAKASGQSGVRFSHVTHAEQKKLDDWLALKLPKEFGPVM